VVAGIVARLLELPRKAVVCAEDETHFRNRSPGQMLDAAAPWTSPWLPAGYEQNFWNAA